MLGQLFGEYKQLIARIGEVVIIIFGLATIGVFKIPCMGYYSDTRPQWQTNRQKMALSSLLMGVVFAAGWIPCVGRTLTLGFAQSTSGQAMGLASGYTLGLAVPFLLIGLGMNRAFNALRRLRPPM